MRHTNRIARRPLDMIAVRKANRKLWRHNPQLQGRKLTMGANDYLYRQEWMDAYLEFLEESGGGGRGAIDLEEIARIEKQCERERARLDEKELKLAIAREDVAERRRQVDTQRDTFRTERPSRGRRVTIGPPGGYGGGGRGAPGGAMGRFGVLKELEKQLEKAIAREKKAEFEVEKARRAYQDALRRARKR